MSSGDSNSVPVCNIGGSERAAEVSAAFAARFKHEPDFCVRVPGRVNLIGEHIDYCGYGVCPMALRQDISLAVSVLNEPLLKLANTNASYKDFECDVNGISIVVKEAPEWYQYFLCGVKGILEVLPKSAQIKGMKVLVNGNIPPSSGLSSSSALVCSAALATSYIHECNLSKEKLASLCAESEKYIGTQGGGMDQAIAFLATEGCAKLIEFSPLRSQDVALPRGAVFVIAHSLAKLNKAATADFNCRVVECRLAAQIIAKNNGLEWQKIRKLGELQEAMSVNLTTMISMVNRVLHKQPYTKQEVVEVLETTSEHLNEVSLTPNTKDIQSFKLHQRALHVFEEALRVQKFHQACKEGDLKTESTLGELMSASHKSLKELYECSHPQLDKIVDLSEGVAHGVRLTGAGWGGCAVALVAPHLVEKYISLLKEKFYKDMDAEGNLDLLVFSTAPNSGACIYIK